MSRAGRLSELFQGSRTEEIESDIEQQHSHDDELERDLEGQRLKVIERFLEGIENRLDHIDALIDFATPAVEAEPGFENAVQSDWTARGKMAAGVRERALEFG